MGVGLVSILAKMNRLSTSDHTEVVSINLFVALLLACIVIGHLLEENRWMNESITALIIGLFQVKKKQFFRNFMTIMLFGAIGTLISFAIISFGAMRFFNKMNIGSLDVGDYLAIGAIFSATDSVCTLQVLNQDETPLLYSLVFGEGVVNDATSVVLFNAIQSFDLSHINSSTILQLVGSFLYLFATSTILGVVAGLLSAFIIKKLYFGSLKQIQSVNGGHRNGAVAGRDETRRRLWEKHSTDREVALMMLMAYLSYMLAELFYLSAILTVFFCGIVMSHYTWHNVTEKCWSIFNGTNTIVVCKHVFRHAFATLSFVCEIFIFLYVGMDALDMEKWRFVNGSPGTSVGVSSILLGLILVGRAAFVFPLSFIANLTRKSPHEKIDIKQQFTIWWAGLMRGAVSMALAYNQKLLVGPRAPCGHAPGQSQTPMPPYVPQSPNTKLWTISPPPITMHVERHVAQPVDQPITSCSCLPLQSRFTRAGHTQLRMNAIMITSTITVVLCSTVVFGLMTKPLVRILLPSPKHLNGMLSSEPTSPKSFTMPLLTNGHDSEADLGTHNIPRPTSLRMLLATPSNTVHYYWRKFDNAVMRPAFGGRGFVPFVAGSPIEQSVHQLQ
ncbi:unnamed protein product [Camellia sinensis]